MVPQIRVPGQGGQGHPDVAVDELLAGGAGAGVVVDAAALDLGAVARGGRVVDGQQQPSACAASGLTARTVLMAMCVGGAADGADGDVALGGTRR